jgi:hypothetical protein
MINYSKLQELDYVLTTSLRPGACAIRYMSSGEIFNTSIATHVGMLISIKNKLFIAEMLPEGLRINSMKKYFKIGLFAPKIVAIKRNHVYYDDKIRRLHAKMIVSDYFETLNYDFKGVLSYVWDDIKERPEDFYCSEYVNKYATLAYGKIKVCQCTPYDIQIDAGLEDINFL